MSTAEILSHHYFIKGIDRSFAVGNRSHLVYALPSAHAAFSRINPKGPDPENYLDYARGDLVAGAEQSTINALGNAKRAVHQAVDAFLVLHGLAEHFGKRNFPKKLEMLSEIGAFPTRLILSLNERRNLLEHEYSIVSRAEAESLVEVAEMFVGGAYAYFRESVIGVYVGESGSDACCEYLLDPLKAVLTISEVETAQTVDLPVGKIHVNILTEARRSEVRRINLNAVEKSSWLPYLQLMVYCTRRSTSKLLQGGPPGYIAIGRSQVRYPETSGVPTSPKGSL